MKERPILFSGPMVRALLDGTKAQTRRVMKFQIPRDSAPFKVGLYEPIVVDKHGEQEPGPEIFGVYDDDGEWGLKCPYGQPGDRLWVRETWGAHFIWDGCPPSEIPNDGRSCVFYRADGESPGAGKGGSCTPSQRGKKWWPSIHMPRWASRLTLEITAVRVERLGKISDSDAIAEGIERGCIVHDGKCFRDYFETAKNPEDQNWLRDPVASYMSLWDSINGRGAFQVDPWVWVIEFKTISNGENHGH